ncbi:MAG: ATP-dependent sacrificial sulfur transferase LarE [Methanomicrobiales archaeon]
MDLRSALIENLQTRPSLLVAYSGGVDSALLAHLAVEALGEDRVLCVLLDSPLMPRRAVREAIETAGVLDLPLEIVSLPILDNPRFRANPPDRCYHCRTMSARILREMAREKGFDTVADGANRSDLGEYRPGLVACGEAGIVHPFVEVGIGKEDVRRIAREDGLPVWNRPSDACLATRIPYGDPIDPGDLRQVEEAEEILHRWGFSPLRARKHGDIARIEVAADAFPDLLAVREEVVRALREIGFVHVTLDLRGFRSGSMDEGR